MMNEPLRIAVLGTGKGTNAGALCEEAMKTSVFVVSLIVATDEQQGIVDVAKSYHVPFRIINWGPNTETNAEQLLEALKNARVDLLVLAGFLKKIPESVILGMKGRVINVHPSLLPKFGGKGMYGIHVHRAVVAAGSTESGATVHWVTAGYDEGSIIRQLSTPVNTDDSAETLQARIRAIEHRLLAETIIEIANDSQGTFGT